MKNLWRKIKNWIVYRMIVGLRHKLDTDKDGMVSVHEVENIVNGYLNPVYKKIADKTNKK